MRVRRKRFCVCMAMIFTLAFFIYGRGVGTGQANDLQYKTSGFDRQNTVHNEETGKVLDISQPSVFQQWRDHRPQRLIQSASEDCQHFKGDNIRRICTQRMQQVRNYCLKHLHEKIEAFGDLSKRIYGTNGNESTVDVFSYRKGKTVAMYCSVHKVASTFWIRLFRFLHNDTNSGLLPSPEAISKFKVHLMPFKQARPLALAYVARQLRPNDEQFRFMFTRDPYHRLWAVYVDKFVLPDYFFWSYHASIIEDMTLHSLDVHHVRKPHNPCFEVSFENFVRYAVQEETSPNAPSDDHMLPVSKVCNPCAFQPHFIGRMENMREESLAVLAKLNLSHIAPQRDFRDWALHHMQTVAEFVHETVVDRGNLRHCFTNDELQVRLFRAFILGGFLPPEVAQIRRDSVMSSQTLMFSMIKELFLISNRSQQEMHVQRERFMVNAYQSLPWDLLNSVRNYYSDDFDLFGYDPEPVELFAQRANREQSAML